jgi:hypothetical protein
VLDNSNQPIPGVTMRLFQLNQGPSGNLPQQVGTPVVTDGEGQFTIQPAPVGVFKLMADGGTATRPGVWPTLEYDIITTPGQNNTVGSPIYLPQLNPDNKLCVTPSTGGTLTVPQVPGFSLTIAPGSATFPGGSHTGCVTVTPVNMDKVPMVPGFGQQPRFVVTIQPVGTMFNPPAAMTIPNVDGLAPRAVTEMYSYDHDLASFVAIGTATVSDDGSVIKSDPGVGVLKAGWHCGGDPNTTGSAGTCPTCNKCSGSSCVADDTLSCDDHKFCTSGDGKNPGPDRCSGGKCLGLELQPTITLKASLDLVTISKIADAFKKLETIGDKAGAWLPCWLGNVEPSVQGSDEEGTFCCEKDAKLATGHRISGSASLEIAASCFAGLSSLAPEIPAEVIQAVGIRGDASFKVEGSVSDVIGGCSEPQWNEKASLELKLAVTGVFVKISDIIDAELEGPSGVLTGEITAEDFFSNVHVTGSGCLKGDATIKVEFLGAKLAVYPFTLFDPICL